MSFSFEFNGAKNYWGKICTSFNLQVCCQCSSIELGLKSIFVSCVQLKPLLVSNYTWLKRASYELIYPKVFILRIVRNREKTCNFGILIG